MRFAVASLRIENVTAQDVATLRSIFEQTPKVGRLDLIVYSDVGDGDASVGKIVGKPSSDLFIVRKSERCRQVLFPRTDSGVEPSKEVPEDATTPPAALPRPSFEPDVPEGVFPLDLVAYEKIKKIDRHFVKLRWIVRQGFPVHQGKYFEDLVQVWPLEERARFFARAFDMTPEELPHKVDSLVGKSVWVQRMMKIREDGSPAMVHHYFSINKQPPPIW